MSRFKDFDAAMAEKKREKISFKLNGVTYELPPALPAMIMLELQGLDNQDDLSINKQMGFLIKIFGQSTFEKMCNDGMDMEQMAEVLEWAFGQYGGNDDSDDGPGNAQALKDPRAAV